MTPENLRITTAMLWQGALLFALLDAPLLALLARRVDRATFRLARWALVTIAGLAWFGIWSWAVGNYWETVYVYVFPVWARAWLPAAFGLLNAALALGLWALALQRRHPAPGFSLLGGSWGVVTHIWAVARGIVTNPPMLQGASPVAAVLIAFFEYALYWGVILGASTLVVRTWSLPRKVPGL